jgi:hypothetical protein
MQKVRVTATGEEHGLIKSVANSVKGDEGFKNMDPETKAKAEKIKKEDSKIVKARYMNHQGDRERLDKPYCRYAGDNIDTYHLIPGEEYDLPYGFIKEVNSNPGLAQRSDVCDANGVPTLKDGKHKKIHELVPVGF